MKEQVTESAAGPELNTAVSSIRIPPIYQASTWRNTTPVDAGEIGVGFDVSGSAIRLRLSLADARHLSDSIADYLRSKMGKQQRREVWAIEIDGDAFWFKRLIDGAVNESYRAVGISEASVWAVAVIQGFEPPRVLRESDRPAG